MKLSEGRHSKERMPWKDNVKELPASQTTSAQDQVWKVRGAKPQPLRRTCKMAPRGGKLLLGYKHGGTAVSRGAAVLLLNTSISVYMNIQIMCMCFFADV